MTLANMTLASATNMTLATATNMTLATNMTPATATSATPRVHWVSIGVGCVIRLQRGYPRGCGTR